MNSNFPKRYSYESETESHSWSMPSNNGRQDVKFVRVPDYDMIDRCVKLALIGATLSVLFNVFFFCVFAEEVKRVGWCFSTFLLLCCCTAYYFLLVHPFIAFIRKWKRS